MFLHYSTSTCIRFPSIVNVSAGRRYHPEGFNGLGNGDHSKQSGKRVLSIGSPLIPPAISHILTELVSTDRRYPFFACLIFQQFHVISATCRYQGAVFIISDANHVVSAGRRYRPISKGLVQRLTFLSADEGTLSADSNFSTQLLLLVSADQCGLLAACFSTNFLSAQMSISCSSTC